MKLYGCTGRSDRIKAAAGWAGVPLEVVQPFVMGVDNKTPEFLAKNPFGKVPVLETSEGACIFESNAIARFLVSSTPCALYPADAAARAKIDAWCDAFNALDCVGPQWLYPIVGVGADRGITHDPKAEAAAKTTVAGFLKTLEATLGSSPHLTGDAVTLADVVGACALQNVYSALYAPADWKPFPRFSSGSRPCTPPGVSRRRRRRAQVREGDGFRPRGAPGDASPHRARRRNRRRRQRLARHAHPPNLHRLLRQDQAARGSALFPRGAARRSHAAVRQRGHEPVQAHLPRQVRSQVAAGEAHARVRHAKVHSRRREAQRSGRRGQGHVPPHLLRDARELVFRRFLQA